MSNSTFNGVTMCGFGEALPPRAYTNEEVFAWHGRKSADWIRTQIGNVQRHTLFDYRSGQLREDLDEDDLALDASCQALDRASIDISEVDAIIFATISPTHNVFPDSACTLHRRLGASTRTFSLTITTGCAGTLNALVLASSLIEAGQARSVLVVSASAMSAYIRPHLKDRMWLYGSIFGDGVSAIVVGRDTTMDRGFSPFFVGANPSRDVARMSFGGSKRPVQPGVFDEAMQDHATFDFRSVPENLHAGFTEVYSTLAERHPDLARETRWVLFNMSNSRVQKSWLETCGIPERSSFFNQERVANCGAASLGILLGEFVETKRPAPGTVALIMAIGTGLQFGGAFYRF